MNLQAVTVEAQLRACSGAGARTEQRQLKKAETNRRWIVPGCGGFGRRIITVITAIAAFAEPTIIVIITTVVVFTIMESGFRVQSMNYSILIIRSPKEECRQLFRLLYETLMQQTTLKTLNPEHQTPTLQKPKPCTPTPKPPGIP